MDLHESVNEIIKQVKQPIWSNWIIKEKIGVGASSEVYRIEAKRGDRIDSSALKIVPLMAFDEVLFYSTDEKRKYLEKKYEVAKNETLIMYMLRNSPYIVRYEDELEDEIYINGQYEGHYLLIRMEILACVHNMLHKKEFELSESNVKKLALDIGKGLISVHSAGYLHRDVKPKNLFYSTENGIYKLGDFNISKDKKRARTKAGTDPFMAPEVYKVQQNSFDSCYTVKVDIYSFGITLYFLMNNLRFPFEDSLDQDQAFDKRMSGEGELPKPKNASDEFSKIILKACAYKPEDRYETVADMVADMEGQNSKTNAFSVKAYTPSDGLSADSDEKVTDPYQTIYAESYGASKSDDKRIAGIHERDSENPDFLQKYIEKRRDVQNNSTWKSEADTKITVVGIGGCGEHIIDGMIDWLIDGIDMSVGQIEFVAVDGNKARLERCRGSKHIQVGEDILRGSGTGAKSYLGEKVVDENIDVIKDAMNGANMVFLCCGMGGGMGTGGIPVIARAAKEMGIFTVGFVTIPFKFEAKTRNKNALLGVEKLIGSVDILVIYENNSLLELVDRHTNITEALKIPCVFGMQVLNGIKNLVDAGDLDYKNYTTISNKLQNRGFVHVGVGDAGGENKAVKALKIAVNSLKLSGARISLLDKSLILFYLEGDVVQDDVSSAVRYIRSIVGLSNIIYGAKVKKSKMNKVSVTIYVFEGNADTQCTLGCLYGADGYGTETIQWYRRLAQMNNVAAQYKLGVMYYTAKRTQANIAEAVKYFKKSAEQGNGDAQFRLGLICDDEGLILEHNKTEAAKWFKESAERGNALAQFKLGWMYDRGEGVIKDKLEAVKWYHESAELGVADAQYRLGLMYYYGEGVSEDKAKSIKWFGKATEQEPEIVQNFHILLFHPVLQYCLGSMYYKGENVKKDTMEAVRWFEKSAKQGYMLAQYKLGCIYLEGAGVTKDKTEATKWLKRSAEQGCAEALYKIGCMYYEGEGVAEDKSEAIRCIRKSAAQGYVDAQNMLKKLKHNMWWNFWFWMQMIKPVSKN